MELRTIIRRKAALILPAILLVIMAAAGCTGGDRGNSGKDTAPTMARIRDNGILLVGTTGDYRPLTFIGQDGSRSGFCIEIAERIAEELDVEIGFVPTSWPTLTSDVNAEPQMFDLAIGGITITDSRKESMLMSKGYLANGKTILCRASDAGRFRSLEDIDSPEVLVMVNPGGTNEMFARENLTRCKLAIHQRNEEIPGIIAEGGADVMITEITEAPFYTRADRRLAAPLIGSPFTNGFIGVLMRKGQEDLMETVDGIIEKMKTDGSLRHLHEKYGFDYSFQSDGSTQN